MEDDFEWSFWRKWMPIDEIDFAVSCSANVTDEFELQLTKMGDKAATKFNDDVSKLIDERRNWNEHSHIAECPGRNIESTFLWMKRWRKWAGKPILFGKVNFLDVNDLHSILMNLHPAITFKWEFSANSNKYLRHNKGREHNYWKQMYFIKLRTPTSIWRVWIFKNQKTPISKFLK